MASGRMLEHVFEAAQGAFDVTLSNAEPRGNSDWLMLSPVLSGEKAYAKIGTHDADWYAAHGVACRDPKKTDTIITAGRPGTKVVVIGGGGDGSPGGRGHRHPFDGPSDGTPA
jgi:nitrite reductase (NADH) large subunit